MPWEERKLKDLRRKFVQACSTEKISMSALCKEYGISRKTGYKWLNRYQTGEQLEDHSRRPLSSPIKPRWN
ncbi:MAG: helix-turn-helix domain-containing protein [Christensenellales bacterium]